jgi:hypothetical protein
MGIAALLGAVVPWALAEGEAEVRLALGVDRAEVALEPRVLFEAFVALDPEEETVDMVVVMDAESEALDPEAEPEAEEADAEAAVVVVAAAAVAVLVAPWT